MDFLQIIEKNWKTLLGGIGVVVVGVGIVVMSMNRATTKEKLAQESYFTVEKKLVELKTKKAGTETTKAEPVDFSAVKKDLEKVISDFPGSIASQMAALHLAALSADEKNFEGALATLRKVEGNDPGLVNTLVQQEIGQLLADSEKCNDAISIWQKIIDRKEASFVHNEVKIQQALCYTKLKDWKKAEEILTNMANQNSAQDPSASASAKEAEKYLRLVQFKKASGT